MFKLNPSITENLSLEEVTSRLEKHDEVDAILLAGSGGTKTLLPHSDYDIVLVLKSMPVPLFSVFTYIDHKLGDVYFFTIEDLDKILSKENVDAEDMEGKLLGWVQDGQILTDKSGRLQKLKDKSSTMNFSEVTESKKYAAWFGINFNYAQNMRYYNSGDELYLKALDIRLLYCVADIVTGYFAIRNIPWRGEKAAIKWLKDNDQKFLESFEQYLSSMDRNKKVELYAELVKQTLAPIGEIWKSDTGVTLKENFSQEDVEKGLSFWDSLVSEKIKDL